MGCFTHYMTTTASVMTRPSLCVLWDRGPKITKGPSLHEGNTKSRKKMTLWNCEAIKTGTRKAGVKGLNKGTRRQYQAEIFFDNLYSPTKESKRSVAAAAAMQSLRGREVGSRAAEKVPFEVPPPGLVPGGSWWGSMLSLWRRPA